MSQLITTKIQKSANTKRLAGVLIILVLASGFFLSNPKQTSAFWWSSWVTDVQTSIISGTTGTTGVSTGINTGISVKNLAKEVVKEILKGLARRALAEMTKSTVNWINSGYHGSPLFLEKPESFFRDIAKYEIRNFVDTIGYDRLRYPFGRQLALNVISSYRSQAATNAEYTLSKVIKDPYLLDTYRRDFNGGWDGFLINTQFPQNNYVGFQITAADELARRFEGVGQTNAQKVREAVSQGQGFLSPQTCPSNTKYNTLANQFKQPKWNDAEYRRNNPPPCNGQREACEDPDIEQHMQEWEDKYYKAMAEWDDKNACPKGLVTTTPGSVVAGSIMKALGASQDQASLSAAMGNSMSAIFDALLNRYIDKGLNALATKISSKPDEEDNWDYEGQTLGVVTAYDSTEYSDWSNTPDEPIILSEFKADVDRALNNTGVELTLMDNENPERPGIIQLINKIWPKIRELDLCVPGPNLGWEDRLDKERDRNAKKLQEKINDDDGEKSAQAELVYKSLQYVVSIFKDWMKNKTMSGLRSSLVYLDAVDEIEDVQQQAEELTKKRRAKSQAFYRLKSIQSALEQFTDQPEAGSTEEKSLVALKKQFNATRIAISNSVSIEDTRNELETSNAQLKRLEELNAQCRTEKEEKGWQPMGNGIQSSLNGESEQKIFCSDPIKGGYSFEAFRNPLPPTHPEIPMVNAKNILEWRGFWGTFFTFGLGGKHRVDIQMSCNIIYRSSVFDYKKDIPGPNPIKEEYLEPELEFSVGGACDASGNIYAADLRSAMDAVISAKPDIANKPNLEDANGYKENGHEFLKLVEQELINMGFNASADVLNGNNNPNTGDAIAVWKTGNSTMERYDALMGGGSNPQTAKSIAASLLTDFTGFIPLNCTTSGGGTDCGCQDAGGSGGSSGGGSSSGGYEKCTDPAANNYGGVLPCAYTPTTPGVPRINSISPMTAKPGETTITISGTDLTSTVQFYDGSGGRTTVVGSVNPAKTQVTILVPAEVPIGNATVKIYKNASTISNGILIQISSTGAGGGGGSGTLAPSYDATAGYFGSLAYNSVANNFLVVSASTAINGRVMGPNGAAVTSEFKINTDTGVQVMSPKAAYAPSLNKYLVVWIGFPSSSGGTIYGRFVGPNGAPSGGVFTIFTDPAGKASFFSKNSILQYDSGNKKFVFAWEYRYDNIVDANLVTVSESGAPDTVVDIGTPGGSWSPVLSVNTDANEYCLAYSRDNGTTNVVRRYSPATGSLSGETSSDSDSLGTTGIVYNSVNKKYMITWPSKSAFTTKGKILNTCNINDGGSVLTINSTGRGASIAHNPKSNNYAVIVQNQNDEKNGYNILSSTGSQLKSGNVFSGGNGNFSPVITANTGDGSFAAISSREYALTRFAPNLKSGSSSSSGGATAAVEPVYLDLGAGEFPDVAWYSGRVYIAYRSDNAGKITLLSFDSNLGDRKTEKIFTLNAGAGGFPRLTVSGGTLWLAYRDGESSGEDIKLWRKDTGATESLGPAIGNNPVALGGGYVAWQKCEGANCADSKVYRRPLAGGTPVFVRNWLPTGISRVLSNGSVVMIDTDRTAVSWGLNAWFAGNLTVAADVTPHDDNGVAGRFNNDPATEFNLWLNQRTHTPHAAASSAGNYAVATWNPTVRIAVFKQ